MVKMVLFPLEFGSLVIRSILITLKGSGFSGGKIGFNAGWFGCVFVLFC